MVELVCEWCGEKVQSKKRLQEHKKICSKKVDKRKNNRVRKTCGSKEKASKVKHLENQKMLEEDFKSGRIAKLYLEDHLSLPNLVKLLSSEGKNISYCSLSSLMKEQGITLRKHHEALNTEECKRQREETNLKRYGARNLCSPQSPFFKSNQQKIREWWGAKEGEDWHTKEYFEKVKSIKLDMWGTCRSPRKESNINFRRSSIHIKVEKTLEELGLSYVSECDDFFIKNGHRLTPDIVLFDKKIVIEVQGNYWHANPKFYKADDIFYLFGGKKYAYEIWEKDRCRKRFFESFGFRVLSLWEDEIEKGESLKKLLEFIGETNGKDIEN